MGVRQVAGDLRDAAPWKADLAGAEYVIHCGARATFGGADDMLDTNVAGTRNLISALQDNIGSLRRLVFVSSIGAVDRGADDACATPLNGSSPHFPVSEYGRSKQAAERLVRESGLPFCIVRPAMVVGADMRIGSHFSVFI